MDSWTEDSKSVILTSCYFTDRNEEVYETPYLHVKLKTEQDIDILTSYVEQYKLQVVGQVPLMPLWYILSVTLDSNKSSRQIANELYESGNFASSVANFAANQILDPMTVRDIPASPEESSIIYDLTGRRISDTSVLPKGVYIQGGKKYLVR